MSKNLSLQDKLILGIIMGVLGWAGLQLIETEKMEERIKANNDAINVLVDLHLRPTKDTQE